MQTSDFYMYLNPQGFFFFETLKKNLITCTVNILKGALSWYGKLTWKSVHAWNLIILCLLIVWGMTVIFMVHLSFYAIPLLIYDVMYDITTIP